MRIENIVLKQLVNNEDYTRKVIPFLSKEYFADINEQIVFEKIKEFIDKYNKVPTKEALVVELDNDKSLNDDQFKSCGMIVNDLVVDEAPDLQWLVDKTEKFCQEKAVYNAIMESIGIIDGKDKKKSNNAIPDILSEALSVSFDNHVGHDFLDDYEKRYDFYHIKEDKIPFDIELLNIVTKGGLSRKSLNIILAGTGVGKSLAMCHMASANLMDGKNVLYITLEMAEEKIAERIDANLLNVPLSDLCNLSKDMYSKKVERIKKETPGKLIVKEYPTATAGAGHFRHLINELSMKRNFQPDIIYIDYLNIATSMRIKPGMNTGSYTYIKAIAEELRGLAVERNVPIVSATQLNRDGFKSGDPDLTDTSESFGLPATADFMVAMISTDELQSKGQAIFKQLKNRYSDPTLNKRFVVGVDRDKMKLYDVEATAQDNLLDGPIFDKTDSGNKIKQERIGQLNFD
tara:strand:- start:1278 stop:2657 length:1380 start_codon:yes stop_codon:yes gene_type:complete